MRTTLPDLLARSVAVHGARPVMEFGGVTTTYAELGARVADGAARLAGAGVRPGEVVGLLAGNNPAQPVALFAALTVGAIVAQLSPLDPPRALARKLADVGARRLITTDAVPMLAAAAALLADGTVDAVYVLGVAPPGMVTISRYFPPMHPFPPFARTAA